jgi:hypothetical protein
MSGESNAKYIYGFISGLGGADITPELVEKAIRFTIDTSQPVREPMWLGLRPIEDKDEYDRNTIKIQ